MQAESFLVAARGFPEPAPLLEEVAPLRVREMAACLAFAVSRLGEEDERPAMIVAPRRWLAANGQPFPHGMERAGDGLLLVLPPNDAEALWAMEQALRSRAVKGVIGAIDKATLTETRRLDFAAKQGGCPAVLLRSKGDGLSAARRRWRIGAGASAANPYDEDAPGRARLTAELVRRRDGPPGAWILEQDDATDRFRLAGRLRRGGVVEDGRAGAAS